MNKKMNAKVVAFIGMLGALSMVLMLINVSLPFAPTFLKFDIAELPALFAGFFLGPVAGVLVVVVKILLKLVIQGTETAFVGEFSNVVSSTICVLIASIYYARRRTKKAAIIGMTISSIAISILFIFVNAYVMFPMYVKLYGMPWEAIIGMGSAANPLIKDTLTLMIFGVFPFNLIKHGVTSLITYLLYRRTANALKSILWNQ